MKSWLSMLTLTMLGSLTGWAQKPPFSATLTNPTNQTVKVDPHQKPPMVNLPCKMDNGMDRPFACEFRFDKLEFIGNDGVLLGSTATVKQNTVPLSFGKAKKKPLAGQDGPITYAVKAYFTRINKPAFPVQKGYLIQSCPGVLCFNAQPDQISTILTNLQIPSAIGKQTVVPFDISWTYRKGKEADAWLSLYIENDATTNEIKFKPAEAVNMRDKAEASVIVLPLVKVP